MGNHKGGSDNAKQALFVEAYIETMNPIASAKKAGYAFPDRQAYRLLACDKIKNALKKRRKELMLRHGIDPDTVLKFLADTMSDKEVAVKERLIAADKLCKHLGLFEADNKQVGEGIGKGIREQIEAGARAAKGVTNE